MKSASIVIGANYGDEGKGLITDFLTRRHRADIVCRFNGGAQAGHTVVLPNGKRHVFHHLGAGTLAGADTYLAQRFIINPIMFATEHTSLGLLSTQTVFVHPAARMTTPIDMLLNQAAEIQRGKDGTRHGSVGLGINETVVRYESGFGADLEHDPTEILKLLRAAWLPVRMKQLGLDSESRDWLMSFDYARMGEDFARTVDYFRKNVTIADDGALYGRRVVFEGAQGLALSETNTKGMPHLTRSNTGIRNAMEICSGFRDPSIEVVYVTRSYLTRHGAGDLPGECGPEECGPDSSELRVDPRTDMTNVPHDWQGTMRYAPIDFKAVNNRITEDIAPFSGSRFSAISVAVTWCDAYEPLFSNFTNWVHYASTGPTHEDVAVR